MTAPAGTLELAYSRVADPAEHTFTCRLCGEEFATVGGGNWPEPERSTCGPCLQDPEPAPPEEPS